MVNTLNKWARKIPAWLLYVVLPLPAVWWFYLGLNNGLGADPIKALEHLYGEFALQLLIAGLMITPLCRFCRLNLIKFRRALGLMAFFYVVIHLAVWLALDVRNPSQIWADILKRPYITVGMASFAVMIPLAMTSNHSSIRRMGALAWNKLHKITYLAVLLGGVHFLMVAKGFQWEPIFYLLTILFLLGVRMIPKSRPMRA